jgi:hypothetical protein
MAISFFPSIDRSTSTIFLLSYKKLAARSIWQRQAGFLCSNCHQALHQ